MAKAIFTTKISPSYDDQPETRYHFPRTYLNQAKQTVGDWIVYYEPKRSEGDRIGGRQVYFATARVKEIIQDPLRSDHFYALVENYIDFVNPLPFRENGGYYEGALRKEDGSMNKGSFRRAVRILQEHEYERIMQAAFAVILTEEKAAMRKERPGLYGLGDQPQEGFQRPIVESVVKRPFRDAAFSKIVKDIYHQTCSMTGLQIINGGGRSEVQAAHIKPVAQNGPDTVRNGIALCSTVHWMFDRGLLSVDDDLSILVAKGKIPPPIERLLNQDGKLIAPKELVYAPHPHYLKFHRESVFKG